MVSDGTEFAVGDIERLFEEVRQNRKAKHEKWEKYYNRRRKCDEMEIRTGSSDSNSSRQESSSFNRVQRRSGESQYGRKKGSDVKRDLEEKGIIFFLERSGEETVAPSTSSYNLRSRGGRRVESRPAMEMKTQQGGPARARKSKGRNNNPYIEERTRSDNRNARRRDQQRKDQERQGASTSRSISIEVLVGDTNYKS
ncbi:uncharacterized protein TNCV_108751 [Trichonephila clavipes]|nr:uncharacterized protein TNCV_108751 [Trichonephila clavipes]